jgi:DNA-binding CsgD family transcriptional regulator
MQDSFNLNTLTRVSSLLGRGYTQKEIADELKIHRVTVARYKKALRIEYGLEGRE